MTWSDSPLTSNRYENFRLGTVTSILATYFWLYIYLITNATTYLIFTIHVIQYLNKIGQARV